MKIAFIGNMNNNHFSMMRYFIDAGFEAHLLKFANEFQHFQPECDTWEINKYSKFIHEIPIDNGDFKQYLKFTSKQLHDILKGYDFYIGCGFAPAYMAKAGIKLDLFLPYCVGIEYTYRIIKGSIFDSIKEALVKRAQIKSIQSSVGKLVTIDKETIVKSERYGIPVVRLPIPMVYSEKTNNVDDETLNILNQLSQYNYKVFSHVSHFPPDSRSYFDKRNDILIHGFAEFIKSKSNECNPVLIFIEYGDFVNGSKELIKKLGIEDYVIWLPLLKRKQLYTILEHIDIGGGELGGLIWGGTGWEFMCKGKPFFQFVKMSDIEFKSLTGLEMPPIFNTNNPVEIGQVLNNLFNNKELSDWGNKMKNWFEANMGKGLIEKYISLILEKQ